VVGLEERDGRKSGEFKTKTKQTKERKTRRYADPQYPKIMLSNVQRLYNKMDEFKARLQKERDLRECCVFCFSETWLNDTHDDAAFEPQGFSI
jgi:division protein CdvB (Snf7/Vps24/ESCRT-III family)